MNDFGQFALCIAWGLSLFAVIAGSWAGKTNSSRWFFSVRNASMLVFFCQLISIGALAGLFLTHDYTNQYVWQYSNKNMPSIYKFTAIWGGMDGSMLLWSFILSISVAIVAWRSTAYPRKLMPWTLAVANSSTLFFLTIVLFCTNPFRYIKADFVPVDGQGLNPLLQNPYMAIHPPLLYCGFTIFAIPYAFCMGALLSGYLSNEWIRLTRRWTLTAWAFLTAGIVMGGHWAYLELGWGGFWAWDPVENASFFPWLTGTAFLHSVMVQERKNMLKIWNIWLIVLTYGLTVFGTFLTRSGVVQSVHAFAATDIGWVFLAYLAALVTFAAVLTMRRRSELAAEKKIESFFSRETAFLVNNLIFLSICFAVIWGVMFPVLSEAITGEKQSVGIPFFNSVTIPLFLLLIFLMGVGPLVAWKKASFSSMRRTFFTPFILGIVFSAFLMLVGVQGFYPLLSYGLCFFVGMTIIGEFHRGLRSQSVLSGEGTNVANGVTRLVKRHRDRYLGYIVHFGVLVMVVGITASMAHKTEKEFTLAINEKFELNGYTFQLKDVSEDNNENYQAVVAKVDVFSKNGTKLVAEMKPQLRYYLLKKETTSEVALQVGLLRDLYLVLAGLEENRASFKVFINPLQVWLWIGTVIVVVSTIFLLLPQGRRAQQHESIDNMETVWP